MLFWGLGGEGVAFGSRGAGGRLCGGGGAKAKGGEGMFWCKRFISGSSLARRLRSERDSWNKRTIGRKHRASI
jgi:hypothetical protein